MQATAFADGSRDGSHEWAESCAGIVEMLDEPALPRMVGRALSTLVSFDDCKQMVYSGGTAPVMVHVDSPDDDGAAAGLKNFLDHSYSISPFYRMYRSGGGAGVHRLREIAHFREPNINSSRYPVSMMESEEIGYLTDGMQAGNEELCVGLPMPYGACALISLTREKSHGGYSAGEVDRVKTVLPFLTAVLRRHWGRSSVSVLPAPTTSTKKEMALHKLGTLSSREQEVVQLLIGGHSTLSISLQLGISGTTVKTHRKNLYSKLGIATQNEHFSGYFDILRGKTVR